MSAATGQTKFRIAGVLSTLLLLISLAATSTQVALSVDPANQDFYSTWARTDLPVAQGVTERTWMWAPQAFTDAFWEGYEESPGGFRAVQYYDKSRMEINDPDQFNDGVWFVTNGLLVVEMIEGQLQVGDAMFTPRAASGTPVAGDPDDMSGPTYGALSNHLASVGDRGEVTVTSRIDRDGVVVDDPALASWGVTLAHYDEVTGHNIAAPFWEFMNSSGIVYQSEQYVEDDLFLNPFYATGRPITEPFFADVKAAGTVKPVLLQCFERRCLTYTPDNPEGWQVEAGNVGLHYFCWRYGYLPEGNGACIGSPVEPPDETPPGNQPPPPPAPGGPDATATPPGGGGEPTPTDDGMETRTPGPGEPTATPTTPGGGEPTPTTPGGGPTPTPTPPSGNAPGVDLLPLNLPDINAGVNQSFSFTLQVRNTGAQTDDINVRLRTAGGVTTCPFNQTQTRTVGPGQTVSVTFTQSCTIALNLLTTYEGTATINRAPGASDTETDSVLVNICLACGGGPDPTPTSPAGNAPGVDVLPLNLPNVDVGLGESFGWPVQVRNTGTQTDTVNINFRSTGGITTCGINQNATRTINPGQTVPVSFNQSCLIALSVLGTYQATATISRSPGATDSESDTALVTVSLLGGGGDPDPTATPPGGNAPGVDVLPLNIAPISAGIGDSFSIPVEVRNTGSQTDDIRIQISMSGISTCSFSGGTTRNRTVSPGQTVTVTVSFTQSCLLTAGLLATYQATATIDRAPGASDSESDSAVINVCLLCASGPLNSGDGSNSGIGFLAWTFSLPGETETANDTNQAVIPRERVEIMRGRRRQRDQSEAA